MAADFIDLAGRVSVVTGGSRGIGFATALELARAGSDVALFDLDGDQAGRAAGSIERETGRRARGYGVDVRKSEVIGRLCDAVAADFGGIDHIVNNAGVQYVAPLAAFPDEKWDFVTSINLDGVFYATKAVWPHMVARKRGRIVNVASVHGLLASPYKAAYVAAKHGVIGLTRAAALEGAPFGITVNAVCPGAVLTDLVRDQAAQLVQSYGGGISEDEALERAFLDAMPSKTFIDPQEVAQLCTYLCSDAARSITGAPLSIDGGWSAH
ncbi:MAG: 3-hydroxybutyrate dehydrogenase [Candidatus Eremiobacteraeota bacterium]|nr:3-hydroxybutyrate dehydrogenase [Candidatus Eremiobacteraeota bacterium]